MVIKNIYTALLLIGAISVSGGAFAAAKKQAAIQPGTKVRTATAATGLYTQECYDAYYGCMDQFCITENTNGGTCGCSDLNAGYEKQVDEINKILVEAERIKTEEVLRVQAGANADIIFTGTRRYDENGNLLKEGEMSAAEKKAAKRASLMAMFDNTDEDDEDFWGEVDNLGTKTGSDLYKSADVMCRDMLPESCEDKEITFLRQMYSRQITSDCKGFENSLATKKKDADKQLADANADVRAALMESLEESNKYNLGECMVEFKSCMQQKDACGTDWENCVFTIASENMQNNKAKSVAKTKVATVDVYDITESTMEILNSKRAICERVLDSCVAVRDQVWPSFLREAAPTIRLAESKVESKFRQSCLTDISNCITAACKSDIAGKGTATMEACLAHPDMARSFCKVQIDPCERMEPKIWGYVKDVFAREAGDACVQEVYDCFTADIRCGKDFENCLGLDFEYIHTMCPLENLVVCKGERKNFSMDDLDTMLRGFYMKIDSEFIDQCEKLVDNKMQELCGSTTDCNKFAADEYLGTGSLRSVKRGSNYTITGLISFGSIKMGDGLSTTKDGGRSLEAGKIGVQDYINKVNEYNVTGGANKDGIIQTIEEELNNIAGTINRVVAMIEQDPKIQFCINGRDMSQITGNKGDHTTARYPNLLNQTKIEIANAALRQAQDNYNKKLDQLVSEASKSADIDIAEYNCRTMAMYDKGTGASNDSRDLAQPFAISYDVASGLSVEDLTSGGSGKISVGGANFKNGSYLGKNNEVTLGGVTQSKTAVFNRETRKCHVCTTTIGENCKQKGSVSWFHNNRKIECKPQVGEEKCEDIEM